MSQPYDPRQPHPDDPEVVDDLPPRTQWQANSRGATLMTMTEGAFGLFFLVMSLVYAAMTVYFFVEGISWMFGFDNIFLKLFMLPVVLFLASLIPYADVILIGGVVYYLAEIRDWGWILALCFVFPSFGLMFFGGIGAMIAVAFERLLGRR